MDKPYNNCDNERQEYKLIKLPENFETFDEKRKRGFLALKTEKEKGKNVVGTFCSYTPVELVMAAGAVYVSLCGNSELGIAEAEEVLPKTLCPLIKSSYGLALTDRCPYFYFSDMILGETTCDGKKKMYELLNNIKPVHVMHLPQGQEGPLALESWAEQIRQTAEFIGKHFNTEITEEKLHKAIIERNRIRKAILKAYEVTKLVPSPVSGYELSSVIEATDFHFTDDDIIEHLETKTKEFISRYKIQDPNKPRRPRLMVTGCPTGGVREKVIKKVEDLGADVVVLDSCAGPRTQRLLVDESKDPYIALAEKYLKINCSVMTPNDGRYEDMKDIIEEYKVDGVIEVILHACHTFAVEAYITKKTVTEDLNLPYLRIDTDYSPSDGAQIETRLEAFLEMMV